MIDLKELESIVAFMRARGVSAIHSAGLTIELGPEPKAPAVAEPVIDNPEKVKQSRKGPDGLTADEQMDLYGRVLDSELREE